MVNLPNPIKPINTSEKLADIAGVSEKTYRMGAKVLSSDDEELKQRVLSGETSISAGYRELQNENKKIVVLENEKKRKETEGRPSKENCTPIGVQSI